MPQIGQTHVRIPARSGPENPDLGVLAGVLSGRQESAWWGVLDGRHEAVLEGGGVSAGRQDDAEVPASHRERLLQELPLAEEAFDFGVAHQTFFTCLRGVHAAFPPPRNQAVITEAFSAWIHAWGHCRPGLRVASW